jgi:transcriptional regulator with XRE-family HTH domain
MVIADRLKALRAQKNMSQADIEKRTGLLRWYISRVENGHTVPAIETLEKMARALKSPCTHFSTTVRSPPPALPKPKGTLTGWGSFGRDARTLHKFRRLLNRIDKADLNLLLFMAQKMALKKEGEGRSKR